MVKNPTQTVSIRIKASIVAASLSCALCGEGARVEGWGFRDL
jgi:hypothetical protein